MSRRTRTWTRSSGRRTRTRTKRTSSSRSSSSNGTGTSKMMMRRRRTKRTTRRRRTRTGRSQMSKMGGSGNPGLNFVLTNSFNFNCFLGPTPWIRIQMEKSWDQDLDPDPHNNGCGSATLVPLTVPENKLFVPIPEKEFFKTKKVLILMLFCSLGLIGGTTLLSQPDWWPVFKLFNPFSLI